MIIEKFIVSWSTGSSRGFGREYRTFATYKQAEDYLEALNLREDCYEGYLATINENLR
jgi:hypothetical protein